MNLIFCTHQIILFLTNMLIINVLYIHKSNMYFIKDIREKFINLFTSKKNATFFKFMRLLYKNDSIVFLEQ